MDNRILITPILILLFIFLSIGKVFSQETVSIDRSIFGSIGTIKSIYYNSENRQKHYLGIVSFQGGYKKWLSDNSGVVFNLGLMAKGPLIPCTDYCEQERVFSITAKCRYESDIFDKKITYGFGLGITNYTLNLDEMYDDSLNIESEALYENRTGLGLDLAIYYNVDDNLKLGINYNPNIFEFREKVFKYYHTLFIELRYDIEL